MLCVPEGFAHGFQALEPDSEVLYLTTAYYAPDAEGGLRYDDPALGIKWPLEVTEVSRKDAAHPLLKPGRQPLKREVADQGPWTFGPIVIQEQSLWREGPGSGPQSPS